MDFLADWVALSNEGLIGVLFAGLKDLGGLAGNVAALLGLL